MPEQLPRVTATTDRLHGERRVGPLTLAALAVFALAHLLSGIMIERAHAHAALAAPVLDDPPTAACPTAARPPQPSLPYD